MDSMKHVAGSTVWTLHVAGSTEDGELCMLEEVRPGENPEDRMAYWRKPENSRPFHHDICLVRRTVSTTYTKVV